MLATSHDGEGIRALAVAQSRSARAGIFRVLDPGVRRGDYSLEIPDCNGRLIHGTSSGVGADPLAILTWKEKFPS